MKSIYSIGIYFYKFIIFIASFINNKASKLRIGQNEALDVLAQNIDSNCNYVWFHAASLGEFEQGRPVIEMIKKEVPATKILLTFFSPSGYEIRKNYNGADIVSYLPLDTAKNAKRFVEIVKPSKAIFIKYEFWPNYLIELKAKSIPVYSISAIFRPSQVFFKWYGSWYKKLLLTFDRIFVQDVESKNLLLANGIDKVSVAGDTRFDRVFDTFKNAEILPLIQEFTKGSDNVLVAGSTWMNDELHLVKYLEQNPTTKLILVPHEIHANHIDDISKLLKDNFVCYSKATIESVANVNCLIVDVIGLLSSIYKYANVAYIGGGFGVGIHNTLEAAVYGVPVVFGPNFQKFREARELISLGAAFSIKDYASLEETVDTLFKNSTEAGKKAGEYVAQNIGASDLIVSYLSCK